MSEPNQPPLIGVAITYIFATLVSFFSLSGMIYILIDYEKNNENVDKLKKTAKYSRWTFIGLAAILSLVTIMMGIRLCLLRKREVPVIDGRNTLLKYYLVFTVGYIMRAINNYF